VNSGQARGPAGAAFRLRRILAEAAARGRRVLVLGMGNPMLGDDGVGVRIAEDVAALGSDVVTAVPVGIALENAAHLVGRHRADVVLLVDAALGVRGSWGFLSPGRLDTLVHSTHSVPLPVFVELWQREDPALAVHVLGVTPRQNGLEAGLSPVVEAARREIVAAFRAAVQGDRR
jgi:hydrogenase maturation protease